MAANSESVCAVQGVTHAFRELGHSDNVLEPLDHASKMTQRPHEILAKLEGRIENSIMHQK
jgi:hypothetical protein